MGINKKILLLVVLLVVVVFIVIVYTSNEEALDTKSNPADEKILNGEDDFSGVGLANPASVYCEDQGNVLEIRTDSDGSQAGYCVFPDGSVCEEWAYFRGECQPQQ